ncbi:MAG: 5-dehydro-4-deoxy-D-glucuronate isomerase [Verrucomicrobia bacterium]|nr:5-dehydro-4-deoxy-D-glucuronate isomerase [Verrucomicrobiota bacterium]
MRHIPATGVGEVASLDTQKLRNQFLIEDLVNEGGLKLCYWETDRTIVGMAIPNGRSIDLDNQSALRSSCFCERREIGIVNLGAPGQVTVDGTQFDLQTHDFLYVGKGSQHVTFSSIRKKGQHARFYFVSYPAHHAYPTKLIRGDSCNGKVMGASENSNHRSIHAAITPATVQTCQLVMGMTFLKPGSVWNTMPTHTHARRSEVYFYFSLPENEMVIHLMGEPNETRHLIVREQQAVLSPSWSIHSGVGTANYGFVWAMGGENQSFDDMDPVLNNSLK